MKIEHLVLGRLRTNCYIVKKDNKCLIIDPGDEAVVIKNACKGYEVEEILVTHHHWDHILALEELEEFYHVKHNEFLRKTFHYEENMVDPMLSRLGHNGPQRSIHRPFRT